jgi:hypothetical protein
MDSCHDVTDLYDNCDCDPDQEQKVQSAPDASIDASLTLADESIWASP